jgi:quinol monooxygenase YgiN
MAVAVIQEFAVQGDDLSTTNYDAVAERLSSRPAVEGLIFHSAGIDEDPHVFRIFEAWESEQQAEQFQEEVTAIVGDALSADAALPTRTTVYKLRDFAISQLRNRAHVG